MKKSIAFLIAIAVLKVPLDNLHVIASWFGETSAKQDWFFYDLGRYTVPFLLSLFVAVLPTRIPVVRYAGILLSIDCGADLACLLVNDNKRDPSLQVIGYGVGVLFCLWSWKKWRVDMNNGYTSGNSRMSYRIVKPPKTLLGRIWAFLFPQPDRIYMNGSVYYRGQIVNRRKAKDEILLDPEPGNWINQRVK